MTQQVDTQVQGNGNMILDVFDFNRRCLGVKMAESKDIHLDDAHRKFTVKAIREEAQELEDENHTMTDEADRRRVVVKQVDAMIDAAYFAIGGMARAGLSEAQAIACFSAVHNANMTKKLGVVAARGDMGVPDAVKGDDWVGPEPVIYQILFGSVPIEQPSDQSADDLSTKE